MISINIDVRSLDSIEVKNAAFGPGKFNLGWNLEKVTVQFVDKLNER